MKAKIRNRILIKKPAWLRWFKRRVKTDAPDTLPLLTTKGELITMCQPLRSKRLDDGVKAEYIDTYSDPATAFGTLNDPAYDATVNGATFNYILSLLYRRKAEIEAQIALIEGCAKEQQQAPQSSPLTNETH
jgi:hypothetical protein